MTITHRHEPGNFCWVDLGTSDPEGAKRFYGELFGWSYKDEPGAPGMIYTMISLRGKEVGALFKMDTPQIPPHWNSYVLVKNADQTAEQAKKLGGTLMTYGPPSASAGAFDVGDAGRMAIIQDPTGAVVMAWQPKKHAAAEIFEEPGALCWNELLTNDTKRAGEFYNKLFGWQVQEEPKMEYTLFLQGEPKYHTGGMMRIDPKWGPVPPHWEAYFQVSDTDQTVENAKRLGGKLTVPPTDIENVGRFAWLIDPQGAGFAIIKSFAKPK